MSGLQAKTYDRQADGETCLFECQKEMSEMEQSCLPCAHLSDYMPRYDPFHWEEALFRRMDL